MVIWRNVFAGQLVLAWVHGLAAAILQHLGLPSFAIFCVGVAGLLLLGLAFTAVAWDGQTSSYERQRIDELENEITRLRSELYAKELRP